MTTSLGISHKSYWGKLEPSKTPRSATAGCNAYNGKYMALQKTCKNRSQDQFTVVFS